MSAQDTVGSVLTTPQYRDAIHFAVAPVVAAERLSPGQHVGRVDGDAVGAAGKHFGIVDPFLQDAVEKGQRFWLFLYPNTITTLRHEWTHPEFAAGLNDPINPSEKWIREWASGIPLAYEVVMGGAADWVRDKERGGWGEYLCFGGLLEGESVPDVFWPHYETVTGKKVAEDQRGSFFTCSC